MLEPSLVVTTAVGFGLAAALRGREMWVLRWAPTRHTAAAIAAGLLPALLSTACLLLDQGSFLYEAVLWLGIFIFCGIVVPWSYVLLVEGRSPAALGLRRKDAGRSLLISSLFAAGAAFDTLQQADLSTFPVSHLVGSALQLNVGGLFETFLYCGFLHLRLRDAFGAVPAIVASAAIYSLWHIGTELPLHANPLAALWMLFVVGLLCHSIFATTYNLLTVWPIFFTAGVMHDFVVNLDLPESVGTSPGWTLVGWILALGIPALLWQSRKRSNARSAPA